MNKGYILARAPGGQMRGAATQAMRGHRRGAATKQMPARRRDPLGCTPQQNVTLIHYQALMPNLQFCEATMKKNLKLTLLLVLQGVVVFSVLTVFAGPQTAAPKAAQHKVIAYYFHTNTRCSTCVKIEQYSQEAIKQGFPEELKNGNLEMRIVNYEDPMNRHFIQDYKLVSKSLVLVKMVNGKQTKWTNLKAVWQLTGRKDAFLNYVRKEVRGYLSSM